MDSIKYTANEIYEKNGVKYPTGCTEVLDKGFVKLIDSMGTDVDITRSARVSYGKGTKQVNEDRGLIRYLMRHDHTTPFEMVTLKFHCRMPIFVARQWIRHRTASVNEYSGRYSEMPELFYVPNSDKITKQSQSNKQGGNDELVNYSEALHCRFECEQRSAYSEYKSYLDSGMRKELARINLPLSQYTEWYWQINLHNLFHFLKLRLDTHAQYEIRVYGEAMAEMVKKIVPLAWEAFEDYQLNSIKLSKLEIQALDMIIDCYKKNIKDVGYISPFTNKREEEEFKEKIKKIGL